MSRTINLKLDLKLKLIKEYLNIHVLPPISNEGIRDDFRVVFTPPLSNTPTANTSSWFSQSSKMLNSYEVPIIPNDLRREETMVHIIGALNQLTKISTDIFAKIGSKCDEFQGKIASINQRVDTANAKLEVLKATKKATVVFSSAR